MKMDKREFLKKLLDFFKAEEKWMKQNVGLIPQIFEGNYAKKGRQLANDYLERVERICIDLEWAMNDITKPTRELRAIFSKENTERLYRWCGIEHHEVHLGGLLGFKIKEK
tara:strand:- start:2 stop:334 length:333 start_codon:yes stop_codon:yes gene_type:complete